MENRDKFDHNSHFVGEEGKKIIELTPPPPPHNEISEYVPDAVSDPNKINSNDSSTQFIIHLQNIRKLVIGWQQFVMRI